MPDETRNSKRPCIRASNASAADGNDMAAGPSAVWCTVSTQTAPTRRPVIQGTDDYQRLAATARFDAVYACLLGGDDSVLAWHRRRIEEKTTRMYGVQDIIREAAAIHVAAGTRDQEEQLRHILSHEIIQLDKEITELQNKVSTLALAFAPTRAERDDGWGTRR